MTRSFYDLLQAVSTLRFAVTPTSSAAGAVVPEPGPSVHPAAAASHRRPDAQRHFETAGIDEPGTDHDHAGRDGAVRDFARQGDRNRRRRESVWTVSTGSTISEEAALELRNIGNLLRRRLESAEKHSTSNNDDVNGDKPGGKERLLPRTRPPVNATARSRSGGLVSSLHPAAELTADRASSTPTRASHYFGGEFFWNLGLVLDRERVRGCRRESSRTAQGSAGRRPVEAIGVMSHAAVVGTRTSLFANEPRWGADLLPDVERVGKQSPAAGHRSCRTARSTTACGALGLGVSFASAARRRAKRDAISSGGQEGRRSRPTANVRLASKHSS